MALLIPKNLGGGAGSIKPTPKTQKFYTISKLSWNSFHFSVGNPIEIDRDGSFSSSTSGVYYSDSNIEIRWAYDNALCNFTITPKRDCLFNGETAEKNKAITWSLSTAPVDSSIEFEFKIETTYLYLDGNLAVENTYLYRDGNLEYQTEPLYENGTQFVEWDNKGYSLSSIISNDGGFTLNDDGMFCQFISASKHSRCIRIHNFDFGNCYGVRVTYNHGKTLYLDTSKISVVSNLYLAMFNDSVATSFSIYVSDLDDLFTSNNRGGVGLAITENLTITKVEFVINPIAKATNKDAVDWDSTSFAINSSYVADGGFAIDDANMSATVSTAGHSRTIVPNDAIDLTPYSTINVLYDNTKVLSLNVSGVSSSAYPVLVRGKSSDSNYLQIRLMSRKASGNENVITLANETLTSDSVVINRVWLVKSVAKATNKDAVDWDNGFNRDVTNNTLDGGLEITDSNIVGNVPTASKHNRTMGINKAVDLSEYSTLKVLYNGSSVGSLDISAVKSAGYVCLSVNNNGSTYFFEMVVTSKKQDYVNGGIYAGTNVKSASSAYSVTINRIWLEK